MDDAANSFLRRTAARSLDVPGTLGHALRRYAELENLAGAAAAVGRLGGPADDDGVARVCLCRRPAGERFALDAQVIADRFGLDLAKLVHALRQVEGAEALAGGGTATTLAARREEDVRDD